MTCEPKSISDHIDCLARLMIAPQSFVMQIEDLFSKKGISLDEDAEPYLQALEEAFKREESIRASASAEQDSQLEETSIPGADHRTLVTRPQRENLPMVPGPTEIQ